MLKQKFGIAVTACAVISLGACSEKTKTKEVVRPETPWYQLTPSFQKDIYGEAVELPHAKRNCLQTAPSYLAAASVDSILVGQRDTTTYDVLYDVNDDLEMVTNKLNSEERLDASAQDLFVCDPTGNSENLEGVAAYAMNDIKAAASWYNTVQGTTLPNIMLQIHPLSTITTYGRLSESAKAKVLRSDPKADVTPFLIKEDLVDNAYWTFDEEDRPTIAVMPHTSPATEERLDSPIPLWELPFVLRHEYGHHVFYNHMKNILDAPEVNFKDILANNPRHQSTRRIVDRVGKMVEGSGSVPYIDTFFLLDAVNEGFADLYAYYASGQKMIGIEDAPCFVETRDVSVPTMAGVNAQKIFTADLLDVMFNHKSKVKTYDVITDATCNAFWIADPHMVGAVIAYAVDQIFAGSPAVQAAPDKALAKTKLALEWLDRLNTNLALAENGPALILSQMLEEAVLVAAGDAVVLDSNSALCGKVKTNLPGFKTRWSKNSSVAACFAG